MPVRSQLGFQGADLPKQREMRGAGRQDRAAHRSMPAGIAQRV